MAALIAVLVAVGAALVLLLGWPSLVQLILVAIVAYLAASGAWRWFYVAAVTSPRDLG